MPARREQTRREQTTPKIREMLEENPQGLRFADIFRRLQHAFPDMSRGMISGAFRAVRLKKPNIIYSPEKGLWRLVSMKDVQRVLDQVSETDPAIREQDFYESFAEYLVDDLQDCTKAIPLGGRIFGDRWGTPDVIGKNVSGPADIVRHESEIISHSTSSIRTLMITAFGQACAYKSFSHKVYIVIPKSALEEDKSRIESLCLIFGIGLVFFNRNDKKNPEFEIRVRPIKHEPDFFYANKYMPFIERELWR